MAGTNTSHAKIGPECAGCSCKPGTRLACAMGLKHRTNTRRMSAKFMLMDERATEEALAVCLHDIAANHTGFSPRGELAARSARAADLIVELRPSFETH